MPKSKNYEEFVNKFKPKLTTDDCYTPPKIYAVVLDWVKKYYGVNERIIRPFNPNDDYKKYDYSNAVVVDNPPFSILAEIIDYYLDNYKIFGGGVLLHEYDREKFKNILDNLND